MINNFNYFNPMSILDQLAVSLGRRDEVPNQELAKKLVKSKNSRAIKELVDNLRNKDRNIHSDCIKVLYEIGAQQPELIKDYIDDFAALLFHKNNRLAWGGMCALNHITTVSPDAVYKILPQLIDAANKGSVITRDNLVRILIKLEAEKKYAGKIFPLLMEQFATCPTNQFPMYADEAMPVINKKNAAAFSKAIQQRLPEIEGEAKKNRLLKLLKKVERG
jgi:hypothetical protein